MKTKRAFAPRFARATIVGISLAMVLSAAGCLYSTAKRSQPIGEITHAIVRRDEGGTVDIGPSPFTLDAARAQEIAAIIDRATPKQDMKFMADYYVEIFYRDGQSDVLEMQLHNRWVRINKTALDCDYDALVEAIFRDRE